jgi:hypothetical protein
MTTDRLARFSAVTASLLLLLVAPRLASTQTPCMTLGTQSCAPTFTDLVQFPGEIAAVVQAGIMTGCGGTLFCPTVGVTRGDMAVYLENAKHLNAAYQLGTPQGVFADVPVGFPLACWVEQLRTDGITSGCAANPLRYCPESLVNRAQMAYFMLKAKEGANYVPTTPCQGTFSDVPCTGSPYSSFAVYVEELARRCVTLGCSCNPTPQFCPGNSTTKDAMAAFMSRMFVNPITCSAPCQ